MSWKIKRSEKGLKGELIVPPDKSISHRAVMLSSIASGKGNIRNFLFGEDCLRTVEAFRSMGVEITRNGDDLTVHGKGIKGLISPEEDLYLGNSGTTMRLLSGVLSGQDFPAVLTGDESLSKRPMKRILDPLRLMGVEIGAVGEGDHAPLKIIGKAAPLKPIKYDLPVASAQVKSCVLLAGLYADGETSVTEPFQSRDHTERMMKYFSADIEQEGLTTNIRGLKDLTACDIEVPGDISSAAFFIVGALIVEGSKIIIKNVGLNPTRTGILDVLKRMGGDIRVIDQREGIESVGDLEIVSSELKGTTILENEIPLLIDEVPVLIIAALMAEGKTVIEGIHELKVKETDRVKSITENLRRMGVEIQEEKNSLIIEGRGEKLEGGEFDSFGDHRIAMSMAIASLVSEKESVIREVECVATSYPGFFSDLKKISN